MGREGGAARSGFDANRTKTPGPAEVGGFCKHVTFLPLNRPASNRRPLRLTKELQCPKPASFLLNPIRPPSLATPPPSLGGDSGSQPPPPLPRRLAGLSRRKKQKVRCIKVPVRSATSGEGTAGAAGASWRLPDPQVPRQIKVPRARRRPGRETLPRPPPIPPPHAHRGRKESRRFAGTSRGQGRVREGAEEKNK